MMLATMTGVVTRRWMGAFGAEGFTFVSTVAAGAGAGAGSGGGGVVAVGAGCGVGSGAGCCASAPLDKGRIHARRTALIARAAQDLLSFMERLSPAGCGYNDFV